MDWFTAADTFVATLESGAEELVPKGRTYPGTHELVKRDLAAQKGSDGRTPLFRRLNMGEEESPKSGSEEEASGAGEETPAGVKPEPEPEVKAAAKPASPAPAARTSGPGPGARPSAKGRG